MKPQSKLPKEFEKQVREACKHYDKPKRIGKLPLASVALQAVLLDEHNHPTDEIGRGNALKAIIERNVDKLKPTERHGPEAEIYLCLYSYVYEHDPYTNRVISSVQPYLESRYQIPKTTYHARQKDGISILSYQLSIDLAQHTWIEPIPRSKGFMGREEELAYYRSQLEEHGLAVIEGDGGVGKTVLAGQFAGLIQIERPVCWIMIRSGLNNSATGVLYGWASFLAQSGYPQLWAFMRATATEEKQLTDFFPHLQEGLAQIRPLLCLDNLEAMPSSQEDFWSLLKMVRETSTADLLLISRRRPALPDLGNYRRLDGLSPTEVEQLITSQEIKLAFEQVKTLTTYTNGNPRLLELWVAHVRLQKFESSDLLHQSLDSEITTNVLVSQIIETLTEGQQRAAKLLVLSRRPLNGFLLQNTPKNLRSLSDLDIEPYDFTSLQRLGLIQNESGNQWSLSPLLKESLTENANSSVFADETIDFHQWLADLYVLQGDLIEAAYHSILGGWQEKALLSLARQQNILIEQGQATRMSELLRQIRADDLSQPRRRVLRQLRTEIWQLLGNYKAAETEANQATHEAKTIEEQVQVKKMQGELARGRGNDGQAVDHYQEALRLLATKEATLEAWLHGRVAWTFMQRNDLKEAWNEAERAQIELQNTFGSIAHRRGDLDLAIEHFEEAIKVGEERGERRQLMRVYNNLGLVYLEKNNFQDAIATYQKNLTVIEEIGELVGKAAAHLNLGLCYTQIGLDEPEEAIHYFEKARKIFMTLGDGKGVILADCNLAEQHLRIGQVDIAREYAEAMMKVEKDRVPTGDYFEVLRVYAEVLLAQGEHNKALTAAQQALDELRLSDAPDQFSEPYQAKLVCETLVKIRTALGNTAEVEKYESLANKLAQ